MAHDSQHIFVAEQENAFQIFCQCNFVMTLTSCIVRRLRKRSKLQSNYSDDDRQMSLWSSEYSHMGHQTQATPT